MSTFDLPMNHRPPEGVLMTHWVIYDHPSDCPDRFVLRATHIMRDNTVQPDAKAWTHTSIEVLRSILPPGLVRLDPFAEDDPAIAEVWL